MAYVINMPQKKPVISISKNERILDPEENAKKSNKEQMLKEIGLSEPGGLTTQELVNILNCNRETVRRLGNELMNVNKIFKTGRFGHYHLSEDFARQNTGLQGNLFRNPALRKIFESKYYPFPEDYAYQQMNDLEKENYQLLFTNNDKGFRRENEIFNKLLDLFDDIDDKVGKGTELSKIQKMMKKRKVLLLNFSLKVGLLITYIMIEAIRPVNDMVKGNGESSKPQLSKDWIKESANLLDIWEAFKEIAIEVDKTKPISNDDLDEYRKRKSLDKSMFLMDSSFTKEKLSQTFQEMWPHVYRELKDLKEITEKEIQIFHNKTPKEFDDHQRILTDRLRQIREVENQKTKLSK